jgi:hypothetical protein
VTSDDRISALFGYRLAPFLWSINRDDFGTGRLQFSTAGRDIERVTARTNNHDDPVRRDERWIFFDKTKARSFLHVMTFTSKCRDLLAAYPYPSIRRLIPRLELPPAKRITLSTAERYAATAWDSRSLEAWSRPALIMRRSVIRSSHDIC